MKQWRVSWEAWIPNSPRPYPTEHLYNDEKEAQDHLKGLLSMETDHPPRPCGQHVWDVKLEQRVVGEWKVKP